METSLKISSDSPEFDFASESFSQDPYPVYARLRETGGPVWWAHEERSGTGGMWMFPKYEQVDRIMRSSRELTSDYRHFLPEEQWGLTEMMMLNADKPEHTRLRKLAAREFSGPGVAAFEHQIGPMVDKLLDGMLAKGGGDFIEEFARPLPLVVISKVLGVPDKDVDWLGEISRPIVAGIDASQILNQNQRAHDDAQRQMAQYFSELLKAQSPEEGRVIAGLAESTRKQYCSHEEAIAQLLLFMVAGHITTISLVGNGLFNLMCHPDQLHKLRGNPTLMRSAIEELLRFDPPLQRSLFRATLEEVNICGYTVPPGQRVSGIVGSANRDPAQFPDPDRLDVERSPNRHVSFGVGFHRCLGEWLVRAETRIAFERLFERAPEIQADLDSARYSRGTLFRNLEELPIKFC
jgi:cytochrome P450